MSSNLRVNNILPSVGNNVAIGTAGGSVTLTGSVTGDITSSGVSTFTTLSATSIVGVSTLGVTTAYVNTLSGISTIDASAAVSINQNLVFASGKGIDFSATANSSSTMTSELLSDYEEGTWTPVDASGAGLTFTTNGLYVKIGSLVYFTCGINYPSTANGSAAAIGGLPFTVGSLQNRDYFGAFIAATDSARQDLFVCGRNGTILYPRTNLNGTITNSTYSGKFFSLSGYYSIL